MLHGLVQRLRECVCRTVRGGVLARGVALHLLVAGGPRLGRQVSSHWSSPVTSPLIGGQAGPRQPGGGVRGAAGHGGGGHVARRAGARGGTWRPGQLEPQPRQTRLLHAVGLGRHHAVERWSEA